MDPIFSAIFTIVGSLIVVVPSLCYTIKKLLDWSTGAFEKKLAHLAAKVDEKMTEVVEAIKADTQSTNRLHEAMESSNRLLAQHLSDKEVHLSPEDRDILCKAAKDSGRKARGTSS